jgi:CRISPR-associated endonuclease/helicase Cas3
VDGIELAQVRASTTSTIQDLPFGELHYAAPDERVVTRLGAANLDLRLAQPVSHPFSTLMHSIGIPAHMAPRSGICPDVVDVQPYSEGFRFEIGERRYRYTRYGLEREDA